MRKYANEEYVTHKVEEHAYIYFFERGILLNFFESNQDKRIKL